MAEQLDLNAATAVALEKFAGVTRGIAKRIVAERKARDGFRSVDELRTIEGITDEVLAALKADLFVRDESSAEAGKPESRKEARPPTVFSTAIDATFQADASVRGALTENLKPLRADSEAINARLQKAFEKFNPDSLIADERGQPQYVPPGTNPAGAWTKSSPTG